MSAQHARGALLVVFVCVVAAACGASAARERARAAQTRRGVVAFERMPAHALALCRSSSFLRAACPTFVPATPAAGPQTIFARVVWSRRVFEFGTGGEHLGHPAQDRPRQFVHLLVAGGNFSSLFPFRFPPPEPAARIRNGLRSRSRASPLSFGHFAWGCRNGNLFLAPSASMNGGIVGDHLVYWWRSQRRAYAVTLHAWEPFKETLAVLRRIVRSIPSEC
jgi:hypothetical protein